MGQHLTLFQITSLKLTCRVGEDIQSLSRFVGAQHLAFQKLLKKYKKWTGSLDLEKRFREEVLEKPASFSKRDFQSLLTQWTEVLAYVRAPFESGTDLDHDSSNAMHGREDSSVPNGHSSINQEASKPSEKELSSVAELHSIWESGSNVDIDTALATTPLGPRAARAVYWIHPDNIVQLHVLLLQFTRLQKSSDTPPSSRSSRRESLSANSNKSFARTDEDIGIIVCDEIQSFAKRQNSETISNTEHKSGATAEKAAASVRFAGTGDAIITVSTFDEPTSPTSNLSQRRGFNKTKVSSSILYGVFNTCKANGSTSKDDLERTEPVRKWLAENPEVQPLVHLQARRARFVGLKNSKNGGVWATLDRDLLMRSSSRDLMPRDEKLNGVGDTAVAHSQSFPYAILELRVEGNAGTEIIERFNASHLVSY